MNSSMLSTRKGVSVIGVILIILLLAGLGVGGYFGYTQYLAPMMNPYAKLLPEGLKDYVHGANADAFVVYKKDQELDDNFKKLPAPMMLAGIVNSAVLVMRADSKSAAAYVEFTSESEALMAKSFLESKAQEGNTDQFSFVQEDNVLIINLGQGDQAFVGSLLDNPNIGQIDKERLDNQFIAYGNIVNLSALEFSLEDFPGTLPLGIDSPAALSVSAIPVAHAQDSYFANTSSAEPTPAAVTMADFLKDALVYISLKDGQLTVKVVVNILSRDELKAANIPQNAQYRSLSDEEVSKAYENAYSEFSETVPDLNNAAAFVRMVAPTLMVTVALNDLEFVVSAESPLQALVDLAVKHDLIGSMTEGPSKAHDAAKKMHVNRILSALEQYKAMYGNYPEKSICVDEMSELSEFFHDGKLPEDEKGAQSFDGVECHGGYYYQWIPERGYVVWAKMVLEKDGNMELSPNQYLNNLQKNVITPKVVAGPFYAYGDGLILDQVVPTPPPVKVKVRQ